MHLILSAQEDLLSSLKSDFIRTRPREASTRMSMLISLQKPPGDTMAQIGAMEDDSDAEVDQLDPSQPCSPCTTPRRPPTRKTSTLMQLRSRTIRTTHVQRSKANKTSRSQDGATRIRTKPIPTRIRAPKASAAIPTHPINPPVTGAMPDAISFPARSQSEDSFVTDPIDDFLHLVDETSGRERRTRSDSVPVPIQAITQREELFNKLCDEIDVMVSILVYFYTRLSTHLNQRPAKKLISMASNSLSWPEATMSMAMGASSDSLNPMVLKGFVVDLFQDEDY